MQRFTGTAAAVLGFMALASPAPSQSRQSFEIATGPTAGTFFPMGELIAGIVSHPPGLMRCDQAAACGPDGLVVSVRTSQGAVDNVLSVNAGIAASGLAQANVLADAAAGRGVFRAAGRQSHVRAIAALFPETVQLVVASRSSIRSVAGLGGRRVSLGGEGSGARVAATEVLAAYRVPLGSLQLRGDGYEASAALLARGRLDAFFFIGGAPSPLIDDLAARGIARLVPIDGAGRRRLLRAVPSLTGDAIPPGSYRGQGQIQTVSCPTIWIARDSVPAATVYGLVRALFDPANRARLAQGPRPARSIRLDGAARGLTVPLHPGAARYYREVGRLPARPD